MPTSTVLSRYNKSVRSMVSQSQVMSPDPKMRNLQGAPDLWKSGRFTATTAAGTSQRKIITAIGNPKEEMEKRWMKQVR